MPEPLAVIANYVELVDALRARAAALNVSRTALDILSGLHDGYSAHLLTPHPQLSIRTLGKASLGCVLGALGTELLLIENPAAMIKLSDRLARIGGRNLAQVRNGSRLVCRKNSGSGAIISALWVNVAARRVSEC